MNVSPQTPQPRVAQLAALLGLGSGLISSSLIAQAAWANPMLNDASHFLVAQQVVDGLPPPPPVIFGQESLPSGQQYVVVVNSNSDMVLAQVQQIYPAASFQDYNGQRYIQAGLYSDVISAQQQVSTLATSGISAQVASISTASSTVSQAPATSYGSGLDTYTLPPPEGFPSTTVPSGSGSVEFGSSAPVDEPHSGSRSYYVIIPGGSQNLNAITNQVVRLTDGMGIDGMIQSGSSKGSHVRVGPFESRSAASRWTRYFRDFGMDARVSYSR